MTITQHAHAAHAALRRIAPTARVRRLDAADIEAAIREHLKVARSLRRSEPETVVTTSLSGGHVAGAYDYAAFADWATIVGGTAATLIVTTARVRTGTGRSTLIVRARKPGQERGRIAYSS